jgi:acyl-coenzyme A synthetase/AMP-(fatty) acid ligase
MNIVDPILYQCRHRPSVAAICCPGSKLNLISYGRLVHFINNIGRHALANGIKRGEVAAILVADKILHAAIILGLTRLGVITVSARHEKLPKELGVDVAITDAPRQFENAKRVLIADMGWTEGDGKPFADEHVYRSAPDDICRIILTSGTTGEAKGVAFSHRMLVERTHHHDIANGPRLPFCDRVYCDLGLATSPGFKCLLYMLFRGGTVFFFGDDSVLTLQSFDLYNVQAMIASPYALAEYLKFFEEHPEFHCGFEYIRCTGGITSPNLSGRVRARMGSNLVCSYGSTEVGSVARAPAHLIERVPHAVGHIAPWVEVAIVDHQGSAQRPGTEGRIRIRSPYTASSYVGDPVASENAFRGGWFYPGDIGCLTEDRLLIILGREDMVLNIGGDKVAPEIVEQALTAFEGVEQAGAFSVPDEFGNGVLWAAVVAHTGFDEAALRTHCVRQLAAGYIPARFLVVDQLPRNEFGKLDRTRLPRIAGQAPSP